VRLCVRQKMITDDDYSLGIIFDGQRLIFERVLHRQEIYRYFPK